MSKSKPCFEILGKKAFRWHLETLEIGSIFKLNIKKKKCQIRKKKNSSLSLPPITFHHHPLNIQKIPPSSTTTPWQFFSKCPKILFSQIHVPRYMEFCFFFKSINLRKQNLGTFWKKLPGVVVESGGREGGAGKIFFFGIWHFFKVVNISVGSPYNSPHNLKKDYAVKMVSNAIPSLKSIQNFLSDFVYTHINFSIPELKSPQPYLSNSHW